MAGARLARNEKTAVARRSMVSTLPGETPPASQAWLSDRPSWCVDLGPTLQAMTTCDLWLGLAKGQIRPEMKVWREGMACWESVREVEEFALALPDAEMWAPPSSRRLRASAIRAGRLPDDDAAEAQAPRAAPQAAPASPKIEAEAPAVGVVTLAPPSDFTTPAPVVVDHGGAAPAQPPQRRLIPRIDRRGVASMAIGAVIAITALVLATSGPTPDASSRPAGAGARPAPVLEYGLSSFARPDLPAAPEPEIIREEPLPQGPKAPVAAAPAAAAPAASAPAAVAPVKQRAPRGPRAADRGQRRAARKGHSPFRE
jgi:hypothetical protein